MTTPGTASTSDARKRKAERDTEQPPTLPDTSGWVKREPGDVIESGTPYVVLEQGVARYVSARDQDVLVTGNTGQTYWTPPPAEHAPVWSVISTDRDQPTLAWVRLGERVQPVLREWYRTDELLFSPNTHGRFDSQATCQLRQVSSVEVVRTCPETHVPVDRALVEVAQRRCRSWDRDLGYPGSSVDDADLIRSLAALADEKGAES